LPKGEVGRRCGANGGKKSEKKKLWEREIKYELFQKKTTEQKKRDKQKTYSDKKKITFSFKYKQSDRRNFFPFVIHFRPSKNLILVLEQLL
jgi:hypothetical protein